MEQYIKKSALVAEIEKLIKKNELYLDDKVSEEVRFQKTGAYSVLCDLRHFINTLEVKGVDLQEDINDFINEEYHYTEYDGKWVDEKDWRDSIQRCAKHFFELGMQVSNKAQKGDNI